MIDAKAIREYKRAQRKIGNKVNLPDLLAEDKNTDPYYLQPRFEKIANWVVYHFSRLGYTSGVHPRRMHYALVDQVDAFDGKPYRNTKTFANQLGNGLLWARYLELIPEDAIVDHKNPHAQIFFEPEWRGPGWDADATLSEQDEIEDTQVPPFPAKPSLIAEYYSDLRPYSLEVWAEKSTMNDVLVPLCESLEVNLQTFSGDGSLTRVEDFLYRARRAQRPARIFYISDFDRNGFSMPAAVARKIQFMNDRDDLGLDARLTPLVLTPEQIVEFDLPSAPDSNTVELDALEALHPGELARIVEEAVKPYIDRKYERLAKRKMSKFRQEVHKVGSEASEEYEEDWENLESEWEQLADEFKRQADDLLDQRAKLAEKIEEDLEEAAKGIQGVEFSVDPRTTESDGDLFDSTRDYFEQNDYYQERKAEKARWFSNDRKS